jgi:hypothetical protein
MKNKPACMIHKRISMFAALLLGFVIVFLIIPLILLSIHLFIAALPSILQERGLGLILCGNIFTAISLALYLGDQNLVKYGYCRCTELELEWDMRETIPLANPSKEITDGLYPDDSH